MGSTFFDGPDPRGVVGRAGREVAVVRREKDSVDISVVGEEAGVWDERSDVAMLDHAPDVDVSLCKTFSSKSLGGSRDRG